MEGTLSVSGRRISGGDYTAGDCIWRNESPALWNRYHQA
jgi:hypothetical protein